MLGYFFILSLVAVAVMMVIMYPRNQEVLEKNAAQVDTIQTQLETLKASAKSINEYNRSQWDAPTK